WLPGDTDTHTAPCPISARSLHDALPILRGGGSQGRDRAGKDARVQGRLPCAPRRHFADGGDRPAGPAHPGAPAAAAGRRGARDRDRKSTRLNSSHVKISYTVICFKKRNA